MASILPYIRKLNNVFDDSTTTAMSLAFDVACIELHDRGQPEIVYEVIANRIIEAAQRGETDVAKLVQAAMTAFASRKA